MQMGGLQPPSPSILEDFSLIRSLTRQLQFPLSLPPKPSQAGPTTGPALRLWPLHLLGFWMRLLYSESGYN